MDISGPVAILLFFLLLLVDMFFYGFDAAIDNLNEKEILHKAEEEKDRRSVRLSEMVSRPGIYINTVQLVITLINILMGAFYLNIWLQAIGQRPACDQCRRIVASKCSHGSDLRDCNCIVFCCHDLYSADLRSTDPEKNGIQETGKVGICLH